MEQGRVERRCDRIDLIVRDDVAEAVLEHGGQVASEAGPHLKVHGMPLAEGADEPHGMPAVPEAALVGVAVQPRRIGPVSDRRQTVKQRARVLGGGLVPPDSDPTGVLDHRRFNANAVPAAAAVPLRRIAVRAVPRLLEGGTPLAEMAEMAYMLTADPATNAAPTPAPRAAP